jgi:hypothetical protein
VAVWLSRALGAPTLERALQVFGLAEATITA